MSLVNKVKEFFKSEEGQDVATGILPLTMSLLGTWVVKHNLNKLVKDPPIPGQITFRQARRLINLVGWAGYYVAVNGYYGVRIVQRVAEVNDRQKKRQKTPAPSRKPQFTGQPGRSEGFSFE